MEHDTQNEQIGKKGELLYTGGMTAYGRFQKRKQGSVLACDVGRKKQERQAVLTSIRRQRALVAKRLAAKGGR